MPRLQLYFAIIFFVIGVSHAAEMSDEQLVDQALLASTDLAAIASAAKSRYVRNGISFG